MHLTFYGMWIRYTGAANHGIQAFYGLNEGLCIGIGLEKVLSTIRKTYSKEISYGNLKCLTAVFLLTQIWNSPIDAGIGLIEIKI